MATLERLALQICRVNKCIITVGLMQRQQATHRLQMRPQPASPTLPPAQMCHPPIAIPACSILVVKTKMMSVEVAINVCEGRPQECNRLFVQTTAFSSTSRISTRRTPNNISNFDVNSLIACNPRHHAGGARLLAVPRKVLALPKGLVA